MSNNKSIDVKEYPVKYPVKEKAYVFVPHNRIPFSSAAVGITYPDADYCVSREPSRITLFEYVISGEGEVLVDGAWQSVRAGDFYILRCGEAHDYRASRSDPWEKLWVNYVADYTDSLLSSYGVKSGVYHSESVKVYFEELIKLTKASSLDEHTAFSIADRIHKIIRSAAIENERSETEDKYGIRRLISTYIYKKINLDELAEKLHMSKSNMIREFKKSYGVTPYNYLLEQKMESAKILLKETKLSIREIADKLCIFDEHYFSTVFYKKVGIRPREYRNSPID